MVHNECINTINKNKNNIPRIHLIIGRAIGRIIGYDTVIERVERGAGVVIKRFRMTKRKRTKMMKRERESRVLVPVHRERSASKRKSELCEVRVQCSQCRSQCLLEVGVACCGAVPKRTYNQVRSDPIRFNSIPTFSDWDSLHFQFTSTVNRPTD